jgi:hypothetical protein
MKTKSKSHRNLLLSGAFFLALPLSAAAQVQAEDRTADKAAVQTTEKETSKKNEEPMRPDISRDTARLVGPSGEEIHDFLYPMIEDDKHLIRAN